MESAINIRTGKIVDGEDLWHIEQVDKHGYICRGCGVSVNPVSFERSNKKRPHFKEFPSIPHRSECNVEGERKLIAQAKTKRMTDAQSGFPCSFPAKLEMIDERRVVEPGHGESENSSRSSERSAATLAERPAKTQWTARTIRPICRTYMNFPFDRDLPLRIPGMCGKSYGEVFRRLCSDRIIIHRSGHIRVAPLRWKQPLRRDSQIEIGLNCGVWSNNQLGPAYRVVVNVAGWSDARIRSVLYEVETSIEEAKAKAKLGKRLEKSWLFFIGEQDAEDSTKFIVSNHRLICCLTGELKSGSGC